MDEILNIPCVILCGGKSSRMGKNKALLPFGGSSSLAQFQYLRLSKLFEKVYINAKDESLFRFEKNFIKDEGDIFSPALGLYTIISQLHCSVFVLSVDTPFVDEMSIKALYEQSNKGTISTIASSPRGRHPLCAIYTTQALEPLKRMLEEDRHKIGMMIEQIPHKIVNFDSDETFFNLNNKDEYEEARSLLSAKGR